MDSRTNGYEERLDHLNIGDLVNVTISHWGAVPTYCMGIVVDLVEKNKVTLFPSVRVYNLETKKITTEFVGSLKVISKVDNTEKI
mgnify:CR=1 FL=1